METHVGPAGTTYLTCKNHVPEMLEPHCEKTKTTCQTRLNDLTSPPEPPTRLAGITYLKR